MAWKEILEIGLHDLEGLSHLQIRYEDLLASPSGCAAQIFSYLCLDMHPAVTEFCGKISDKTSSPYHARYQDQWSRNDHKGRIGRWRENLTASEQ